MITAPTLLVWGRHDKLVPVSIAGPRAGGHPRARLVLLEDCGHVAQMEHPVRVAQEFLDARPALRTAQH